MAKEPTGPPKHGGLAEIIRTGRAPGVHVFQPRYDEYTSSWVDSKADRQRKINEMTKGDPLVEGKA